MNTVIALVTFLIYLNHPQTIPNTCYISGSTSDNIANFRNKMETCLKEKELKKDNNENREDCRSDKNEMNRLRGEFDKKASAAKLSCNTKGDGTGKVLFGPHE